MKSSWIVRAVLAAALSIAAGGCASDAPVASVGAAEIAASLNGAWINAEQYAQAPAMLKRPPEAERPWLDQRRLRFSPANAPTLGANVHIAEWRADPAGAVLKRDAWSIRRNAQGALMLDIAPLSSAANLAALTPQDLTARGEACALPITAWSADQWEARTNIDACRLRAPDGRMYALDVRVTRFPGVLLYSEAAQYDLGDYYFRAPGGPPYDFRPAP